MDSVAERVRKVSTMRQEAWLKWAKKPDDTSLKVHYQRLKHKSRKAAVEACEQWWEAKAEEAEKLHVAAVRNNSGESLVRDLKLSQWRQKLRGSRAIHDSSRWQIKITVSSEKWQRCKEHLENVCNFAQMLWKVYSTPFWK